MPLEPHTAPLRSFSAKQAADLPALILALLQSPRHYPTAQLPYLHRASYVNMIAIIFAAMQSAPHAAGAYTKPKTVIIMAKIKGKIGSFWHCCFCHLCLQTGSER
jgi:hypothetical protein